MIVNRYTLVIDVPNYVLASTVVSEVRSLFEYEYGATTPDAVGVQLIDSQPHIEVEGD